MARYRKISTCIHGDKKVRQLSRPKRANGRDLWFYLLTGPHTTSLPGLFRAGIAQLAEENEWKTRETAIVFDEILSLGLAKFDAKARVVWLPKSIEHNPPESPNVIKNWRQHYDELPDTPLKVEALLVFRAFLEEYEAAHPPRKPEQSRLAAFRETFPEAFPEALPETFRDLARDARARAQQEQEQEQEQEVRTLASAAARSSNGAGPRPADLLALWNETVTNLPKARELTSERTKLARARLKEHPDLSVWRDAFTRIDRSAWCQNTARRKGHEDWRADIDWALAPGRLAKVLEGKYGCREPVSDEPEICEYCGKPKIPHQHNLQECERVWLERERAKREAEGEEAPYRAPPR